VQSFPMSLLEETLFTLLIKFAMSGDSYSAKAGFQLDMATHQLQQTPCVGRKQALTAFTEYVSRYPSTLQVTFCNLTGTETTGELCAGMVKASGVFPKNPSQHAADLDFLKTSSAFQPAFVDPRTGQPKPVYCIRVDGASDEGPSHEEVQFLWTAQHLESGSYATLVSCRNSGSSYLNQSNRQRTGSTYACILNYLQCGYGARC